MKPNQVSRLKKLNKQKFRARRVRKPSGLSDTEIVRLIRKVVKAIE